MRNIKQRQIHFLFSQQGARDDVATINSSANCLDDLSLWWIARDDDKHIMMQVYGKLLKLISSYSVTHTGKIKLRFNRRYLIYLSILFYTMEHFLTWFDFMKNNKNQTFYHIFKVCTVTMRSIFDMMFYTRTFFL